MPEQIEQFQGLAALVYELAATGHGLNMVMGKGGITKTTVAAALALGLIQRWKIVHLSTTDPAAHLAGTLDGEVSGLRVDRTAPKVETQRYLDKIMAAKSPGLNAQEQALLLEDLCSPCTEEVAVFHAYSHIVSEGRSALVVLDTAPTGHSLLLMDAIGAYHRQMLRQFEGLGAGRSITPLTRLQNAAYTKIILVALPEVTPVSQAAALQDDLRRASIEPFARVLCKSVLAAGTEEPLLAVRLGGERKQMKRMSAGLAKRLFVLPWLTRPPIGFVELSRLVTFITAKKKSANPCTLYRQSSATTILLQTSARAILCLWTAKVSSLWIPAAGITLARACRTKWPSWKAASGWKPMAFLSSSRHELHGEVRACTGPGCTIRQGMESSPTPA